MAATIPIFYGENYEVWNVKMETLFLSMDLWDTVENGYDGETDKENQKKNAEALSLIQRGVSDWIFKKFMKAKKAKEAWDFLKEKFPTEERPTRPSKILAKAKKVWVKAKEEWVKAKEEWPIKALAKALAPLAKALSPRARALAPLAEALAPGNISKSRETNLIVATLIATVAFAAGITMPGGYIVDNKDPNQGMAILTRKKAFKAFVITDTIALTLSIFAVLSHLGTMTDHPILLKRQLALAVTCTTYAMIAMFLAFITGTYAVLASSSLSIFVCVIPSILLVIHLTYSHIYFPLLISEDIQPFSPPLSPPSEQNV